MVFDGALPIVVSPPVTGIDLEVILAGTDNRLARAVSFLWSSIFINFSSFVTSKQKPLLQPIFYRILDGIKSQNRQIRSK
jgi:hypothetical protein